MTVTEPMPKILIFSFPFPPVLQTTGHPGCLFLFSSSFFSEQPVYPMLLLLRLLLPAFVSFLLSLRPLQQGQQSHWHFVARGVPPAKIAVAFLKEWDDNVKGVELDIEYPTCTTAPKTKQHCPFLRENSNLESAQYRNSPSPFVQRKWTILYV